MMDNDELCAQEIAKRAMKIAGDLCVYTNNTNTIEVYQKPHPELPIEERPTLGYWDVRGKGAQVHYLLNYCAVDYNQKIYKRGPAPEFSKSAWLKHRDEVELQFPNLPYLIDGEVKLTESKSIMKYIAKKYDERLLGRTPEEMAKADMVSRVHDSLYDRIGKHFKDGNSDEFNLEIEVVGQILASYFSKNCKEFAAGSNLTFVDFSMFELLDFMNHYSEG